MSPLVKRVLGESTEAGAVDKDTPLQIIKAPRQEMFNQCPHCHQEIFERHTYIDGDFASGNYVERHSGCGGALKREALSPEDQAYLNRHWGT